MSTARTLELATAFATALDREDYPAARSLMADNCTYEFGGEVIEGADNIIASYQSHGNDAREKYENVVYESRAETTGARSATLHYADTVRHAGETLVHRCRQHIEFGAPGLIERVVHEDLQQEVIERTENEAF